MKIVIDIPEENYERLKFMEEMGALNNPYLETIANGIMLPKGHGRLIDADNLMEYCQNDKSKTIDCNDIARFPTTIKADKESEEEE